MQKYLILIFIGISIQVSLATIEEDFHNLNLTGLPELPGNLSSKIPSTEDLDNFFAEKCKKNGGQEAYEKASAAKLKTVECVKNLINFQQLQQEMEEAKPTGDLDSVFKKYCKKTPEFKGCVMNFTTAIQPCLEEKEKDSVATFLNVTEQLAEFICYKEGDRIALFIAEGGPECLNASESGIRRCIESEFTKNFIPTNVTISDIPVLIFKAEHCEYFFKLQTCVVHELETCKEPTPANIIDSLFNFVKKVMPCSSYKFTEKSAIVETRSSASSTSFFSSVLTISFSFFLLRMGGNQ